MPVFNDPEIDRRLRGYAATLEQGERIAPHKIAALLRVVIADVAEHRCDPGSFERVIYYENRDGLTEAIHGLHEQAHGANPFRSCRQAPCASLALNLRGPAPSSATS